MRFLSAALLTSLFLSSTVQAQYTLEVEVVNENIGVLIGALGVTDLTGYSTTRLHINMANTDDFMSSVSGDAVNPTYVNTTTAFYHSALGAATPNGINSLLFPVYPDLVYDSWVTIGLEGSPNAAIGEAAVSTVQSTTNPWATNFDLGGGLPGGNIVIDDPIGGAWYALNGDANGVAGDDLKVLVGQFTTDGDLSGQIYCQIFINGDGSNEFRDTFFFPGGDPAGCTDETACNYNPEATEDDDSCIFPESDSLDCDGNCLADTDGDGICDPDEVGGCQEEAACNYNADATDDDGSCTYPANENVDCDGNCLADTDGDGVCDPDEIAGCQDATACNYDPAATDDSGDCTYPDAGLDCNGECLADADGDGICDGDEIAGCQDDTACNYDPTATDDSGDCTYPDAGLDCNGECLADADGDGICDGDEIAGCQDDTACNYDPTATDDDGSCTFADAGLDCNGECLADADGDGICDENELAGCTDPDACNAGDFSDTDNSLCEYPLGYPDNIVDCNGDCLNDDDGDEICNELEVEGCTDSDACNFNVAATDDDGSCSYADPGLNCDGSCLADADGDGICDGDEVAGCADPEADNFDPAATDDDGSCTYTCAPEWGEPVILPSVATVLALVTVNGENAAADDAVGAFVNGELRGAGPVFESEGATYINMTVYLNGEGETVEFALFNGEECTTCDIGTTVFAEDFGEYGSIDAPLMFDADCSDGTLNVELAAGWNYVSTNRIPENYSISSLFDDALAGNLLKVLGDDQFALGGIYIPGIPSVFNSLQMHTDAAGYVIKVDADAIWSSAGAAIDPANTPMDLNEGWNIIGYLPQDAMSVEEALASIDGTVGTVIDGQNGTVWNPANPNEFNSLTELEPGRSYWVRMLEAATLVYPETTAGDGSGMVLATLRDGQAASAVTGWSAEPAPMAAAVCAEILLDDLPVEGEAYIGAFAGDRCVAVRPVLPHAAGTACQMAIMLEDASDVTFKLWLDGEVFHSADIMSLDGGEVMGQGESVKPLLRFGSEALGVASHQGMTTLSVTPIPATTETWLNFNLAEDSQMRITAFDARGVQVKLIHDGQMAAGEHRLMLDVSAWSAGTYFIKAIGNKGILRTPIIVQ